MGAHATGIDGRPARAVRPAAVLSPEPALSLRGLAAAGSGIGDRWIVPLEKRADFLTLNNGRKIEIANKGLFLWTQDGVAETEYPIDDPRDRGRAD